MAEHQSILGARTALRLAITVVGVLFLFMSQSNFAFAADGGIGLDELRQILADRLAEMNDLSAKIESQDFIYNEHEVLLGSKRVRGSYRAKLRDELIWFERQEDSLDANGQLAQTIEIAAMSYDGNNTFKYRRSNNQQGLVRGWIVPGKLDGFFPAEQDLPINAIWSWMGQQFAISELLNKKYLDYELQHGSDGLIRINMRNKDAPAYKSTLTLDPHKGYLPVEQVSFNADHQILSRYRMMSMKDVGGGFYVPTLIQVDQGEGSVISRTVRLSDISLNEIPVSHFQLDFPDGTRVVDQNIGYAYFAGDQHATRETIEQIDEIALMTQVDAQIAQAEEQRAEARVSSEPGSRIHPPSQITPSASRRTGRWTVAAMIAVLLVGLLWYISRRRA
jgi:hypothetical protein